MAAQHDRHRIVTLGKFYEELGEQLIAHAEHEFNLDTLADAKPKPTRGLTRRDVLTQALQRTGRSPVGLDGPEIPADMAHIWRWFIELDEARGVGMGGVSPITFGDIKAWSDLTGREPTPFEVRIIRRIDRARLRAV